MHRLQRQMKIDRRWDSVIDRLELKYGLHLDDWKRLGRDQMGQKCGRGWVGLRGACERGKKADDNTEKIKKSKRALADKIRARKGLRDRNAPKVLPPKIEPPTTKKAADLKEGDRVHIESGFKNVPEGDYKVTGKGQRSGSGYIEVQKLSATGKLIGKSKILSTSIMDHFSNKGINLDPGPIEKRARREKLMPVEDLNKGRKGPSISPSNVVATDKRFSSAALNNALDQIQSSGADERLSNVRSIVEAQGIQAVFKGASSSGSNQKLTEGIENKGSQYKRSSEFISKLESQGRTPESLAKLRKDRDDAIVGGKAKTLGYTRPSTRHVVLSTGKRGSYSSFSVTPEEMQNVADNMLSPKDGKLAFSASASGKGAASDLTTYLHEVGHQVQWISESKDPSLAAKAPRTKPVSSYGATNNKEFFAEGFTLWTLDAKGLKEKNPEMHDYIEESVTAAMGAKRRMDSITNELGMNPIAPVQPSDIAQTSLGQQAFTIVLSGDSSWDAYKSLDSYAAAAKVGAEQDETMAAIEAFIVAGGEFTEPIDFSRADSTHFDSSEIVRYARAIASLNDRYGWHIDAQKVLSKLGKKLGKKCGKGWISPEKKCKSHYTNGKLNESGKASGENLADRIRQRKKLSTVSRDGKGKELAYAFLPGNQKQSSMTARRTHAPKSGYQTPGRLSNVNSTEERRSMVGLGQNPGTRSKPDTAPIMDLPTKKPLTPPTPIEAGRSLKSLFAEADRIGAKYQDKPQTFEERRTSKQGADRVLNESGMSELVAKASGAASISEARTRKMKTAAPKPLADPMPKAKTKAEVMMSKVRSRNPRLASEGITNKGDYGKIMRLYDLTDPRQGESRSEAVASWKQKQKKRQEHLAKFKAERDAKRSKRLLDRRQTETVKQNDKDRIAKNPLLHAARGVVDPDKQVATRRRLEEAVRNGTLNGAEIQRIAKTVGLQKKEQKALAVNLSGVGVLKKKESTKGTENKFRNEILKGRDRVAGTRPNDITAAGAKLGLSESESMGIYKRLSESESIARRAERAKRVEQLEDATLASETRKLNAEVPRSTAGDRIRAVAKALEDESKIQKGATVGILKSAEKLYVNQNKMIKEVSTMVNEDLDRAAKGTRKMFDPAQTPVRIPNQRSSSEPRKRGRSVD